MQTVKVRNYIIGRDNIAYVKVEKTDHTGKGVNRVTVVFTGHCSNILFGCDHPQQAEDLASDIMIGTEYLV